MGKKSLTLIISGLLLGFCGHSALAEEATLPDRLSTKDVNLKRCSQGELKTFRFKWVDT